MSFIYNQDAAAELHFILFKMVKLCLTDYRDWMVLSLRLFTQMVQSVIEGIEPQSAFEGMEPR